MLLFCICSEAARIYELLCKGLGLILCVMTYCYNVTWYSTGYAEYPSAGNKERFHTITRFHPNTVLASLKVQSMSSTSCWYCFPLLTPCHGNEEHLALWNRRNLCTCYGGYGAIWTYHLAQRMTEPQWKYLMRFCPNWWSCVPKFQTGESSPAWARIHFVVFVLWHPLKFCFRGSEQIEFIKRAFLLQDLQIMSKHKAQQKNVKEKLHPPITRKIVQVKQNRAKQAWHWRSYLQDKSNS